MRKKYLAFVMACIFTVVGIKAQTLPNLGTASAFGVLSGAYFNAADTINVKGKIGIISGNANIAYASLRVSGAGTVMTTALADLATAKSSLTSQSGATISNTLTNQTFSAGVYTVTGNALVTGAITLTGDTSSIFIFNVSGDLTFDYTEFNMEQNNILASKVFWNVGGKVNIIGYNHILGNILAQKKIKVTLFEAGFTSLLSQDSIIINNPGYTVYRFSPRKSYFYSQNTVNSYESPSLSSTGCLSGPLTCSNMITNPSFEDFIYAGACPYAPNDINFACDWFKHWSMSTIFGNCCYEYAFGQSLYGNTVGLTGDFFSTCGSGGYELPYNDFTGYTTPQSARTGDNCAGIRAQYEYGYLPSDFSPSVTDPTQYTYNFRDNALKKRLPAPLTPSKVYYMEFYANLAGISNKSAQLAVYPMYQVPGWNKPEFYVPSVGDPIPLFTSGTAIADDNAWHKVSGCFSTTETDAEYIAIKTYINTSLTDGGIVPATSYDPTSFVSPPLSGVNNGTFWTSYFFIDDIMMKPLSNAGADQTITCNSLTYIGENCTPISGAVYAWTPADAFTTANSSIVSPSSIYTNVNFNASGTYLFNLTVTLGSCTSVDQVAVNVTNNISVAVTNTTGVVCGNTAVSFTAVPTPGGTYTYNWVVKDATTGSILSVPGTNLTTYLPTFNFSGFNQDMNVCVTITNASTGCGATNCAFVMACCTTAANTTKYTGTTFNTTTTLTGSSTVKFHFGGTITVSAGTLRLLTADVTMDPLTKFIVAAGAKLQINECYVHGCNGMWNGIFALSTSTVEVTGSRVEDGIRTLLDSTGGATFSVMGNYFNKNYVAISCKAAKPSTSSYTIYSNLFTTSALPAVTGTPYVTTAPNLTNASTWSSYAAVNLLPPYQALKGYEGIQLVSSTQAGAPNTMIPIGSATSGYENIFDKLQIGVHAVRSNVLLQNNVFQNIKYATNPGTYNTAVMIYSHNLTTLPACNVQIGGSTNSQKNTFIDNDLGVYSWYRNTLNIANNQFTSQATGIYMTGGYNGLTTAFTKNKFTGCTKGISFYSNSNVIATITENRFDNSAATVGAYNTNVAVTLAEATVPAGSPTNYGRYTVHNNYINNYYNGIYSINTYSTQMTDNEVHMVPDNTSSHFQMGIKADGSRFANAFNNTVDMPSYNSGSWWWQYGIFYNNVSAPFINCNIVDKLGACIKIQGPNNTLANTNEFVNNKMSNTHTGLWLDAGGFNADQAYWVGTTAYAGDNTWTGTMTERTYANNGANSGNNILYTQSGANFKVAAADASWDGISPTNKLLGNNSSAANVNNICAAQISTPAFRMAGGGANLFAAANTIADDNNQSHRSISNTADYDYLNRKYLMEDILLQQVDVSADTVLSDFMTEMRQSNVGQLYVVDSLLQTASLEGDSTQTSLNLALANNQLTDPNLMEQNQLLANSIYISQQQHGKLSDSEVEQLRELAVKCPDTDGHAVFTARAILASVDAVIYSNNCRSTSGQENSRMAGNKLSTSVGSDIMIYPNPSENIIYTETKLADGQVASIVIYNIMGEIVLSEKITSGKTAVNTSSLNNGTYLYRIVIDGNIAKADKLIIIK